MSNKNDEICLEIFHFILNENFLISKIETIEQKIELLEFHQTEILEQQEHLLNRNLSFFISVYNLFFALKFFFSSKKQLVQVKKRNENCLNKIRNIIESKKKEPSDDEKKLLPALESNIKDSNKLLNEFILTIFLIFVKIKSLVQENYQNNNPAIKDVYKESFPDILEQLEELYHLHKDIENTTLIMNTLEEVSLTIFEINKKEVYKLEKEKKLTRSFF